MSIEECTLISDALISLRGASGVQNVPGSSRKRLGLKNVPHLVGKRLGLKTSGALNVPREFIGRPVLADHYHVKIQIQLVQFVQKSYIK